MEPSRTLLPLAPPSLTLARAQSHYTMKLPHHFILSLRFHQHHFHFSLHCPPHIHPPWTSQQCPHNQASSVRDQHRNTSNTSNSNNPQPPPTRTRRNASTTGTKSRASPRRKTTHYLHPNPHRSRRSRRTQISPLPHHRTCRRSSPSRP